MITISLPSCIMPGIKKKGREKNIFQFPKKDKAPLLTLRYKVINTPFLKIKWQTISGANFLQKCTCTWYVYSIHFGCPYLISEKETITKTDIKFSYLYNTVNMNSNRHVVSLLKGRARPSPTSRQTKWGRGSNALSMI